MIQYKDLRRYKRWKMIKRTILHGHIILTAFLHAHIKQRFTLVTRFSLEMTVICVNLPIASTNTFRRLWTVFFLWTYAFSFLADSIVFTRL